MSGELVLRVRVIRDGDLDREIAGIARMTFVRQDGELFVRCAPSSADEVRGALARAGMTSELAEPRARRASLRAAVVRSLAPVRSDALCDTVEVRRPSLGEAVDLVRAMTRDVLRRRDRERRERVRALLRDEDQLLSCRRVLWAEPRVLRAAKVPGARPVVFDRDGVRHAPEVISFASAGQLARWALA